MLSLRAVQINFALKNGIEPTGKKTFGLAPPGYCRAANMAEDEEDYDYMSDAFLKTEYVHGIRPLVYC